MMNPLNMADPYLEPFCFEDAQIIKADKRPGTLNRCEVFTESGLFKLSDRECALYSIQVVSCGSWGSITTYNAKGEPKFFMPSNFTGSFFHKIWHEGGMYLRAKCIPGADSILTISWEELDN